MVPDLGLYYCFGCHKGGGVINFVMEVEGLEYPDAVRNLAKRAGMELPEEDQRQASTLRRKERLWELCRDAARYYHSMLKSPQGQAGLQYLLGRGLTQKTITSFGLGFAPKGGDTLKQAMLAKGYTVEDLCDAGLVGVRERQIQNADGSFRKVVNTYDWFRNRVMFPISDVRGNVIGFGGRVMDGSEPKYLNSRESLIFNKRKNLFALDKAKKTKMGMLVLTEGYMDTITMHQYGFDGAVASLGTALTGEQAGMLAKYTKQMVLCYDGDAAGQNAAKRAIGVLEPTGISVRVLRMEGAKDPDEFLKKFGAERFRQLLGASEDQAVYQLETIRRKHDLTVDDGKVSFLKEAAEFISTMSNQVEREVYCGRAAEIAGVKPDTLMVLVEQNRKAKLRSAKKKEERKVLRPAEQVQPADSSIKYDNVRSAMAEEGIISQLLLEPGLLSRTEGLREEDFSSPLLGRVYGWIQNRWQQGLPSSVPAMAGDFQPQELSHITRISQKHETIVNEKALGDYIAVVRKEASKRGSKDLMAALERNLGKKGYGG